MKGPSSNRIVVVCVCVLLQTIETCEADYGLHRSVDQTSFPLPASETGSGSGDRWVWLAAALVLLETVVLVIPWGWCSDIIILWWWALSVSRVLVIVPQCREIFWYRPNLSLSPPLSSPPGVGSGCQWVAVSIWAAGDRADSSSFNPKWNIMDQLSMFQINCLHDPEFRAWSVLRKLECLIWHNWELGTNSENKSSKIPVTSSEQTREKQRQHHQLFAGKWKRNPQPAIPLSWQSASRNLILFAESQWN